MRPHLTIARSLLTGTSIIALPSVAFAADNVTAGFEVSTDVGYANNPFLVAGPDTGSGFAEARISPEIKIEGQRSTINISASADYQRYFKRYNAAESYFAALDYSGTPNARLKTHFNFHYDNAIVGQNLFLAGPSQPSAPSQPVTTGTDISLIGTRDRRQTAQASGDLSDQLSEHDTVSASAYYLRTRYNISGPQGDYNGYGGSLGYSRLVSERIRLGVQGSVARYDYRGLIGGITVYSPQASFSATLSPYWKAEGGVGASFVSSNVQGKSTSFSGSLRLCRTTSRSDLCFSAQRAVLPTGLSGTQNTTIISGAYSYKLSPHGSVYSDVSYNKNGSSALTNANGNSYLRGIVGYRRELSDRVNIEISGRYSNIFGGSNQIKADYGAKAGIVVKFGRNH